MNHYAIFVTGFSRHVIPTCNSVKRDARYNVVGRHLMCLIITHVKVQISNHSAYGLVVFSSEGSDNAHRFDIVFRESVSQPATVRRIGKIIFRLRERNAAHNVFANLRYKRPVNLLTTREFQRNDARNGDLTPRACQDRR